MKMAELLTGARKTYGMNLIGGVRRDIQKAERTQTIQWLHELKGEVTSLVNVLLETPNIVQRTAGIGRLEPQVARDYSPVGPNLRGSGFERDTRVGHPYVAYDRVPWKISSKDSCDVLGRTLVRVEEFFTCLEIVERLLDEMPDGPILTEGFTYKPGAYALGYVEAPRGEDIHWAMLGDNQKVYRWRCRASSYNNWPALRYMLQGNTLSDAPLIVASIDPCYSCTERVTVVDVKKNKVQVIPYKEIERYGIERKNSPLK
jgi:Ni,Fe-hydrogenase III large subunit